MSTVSESRQARSSSRLRRIWALMRKESFEVVRDPSSIALGIVMPVMLVLLFGYGLSLDLKNVPVAVVMEDASPDARELVAGFQLSPYFNARLTTSMPYARQLMLERKVNGIVRIRSDFSRNLAMGDVQVQVLVHGADANTARIMQVYAQGAVGQWAARRAAEGRPIPNAGVTVRSRLWFNEANDSRYFLVPGLIVLIMTLIGAFLTALVMAREWERGTFEAMFVTPIRSGEILVGKTAPYFMLGMIGLFLCILSGKYLFEVPLRGSTLVLTVVSVLYLLVTLATGLLISSVTKSQFIASQVALVVTFLPAMMLSGFLFDLRSMPAVIRAITYITPARYYVALLQTIFLAGDIWSVIVPNAAVLAALAAGLLVLSRMATTQRLTYNPWFAHSAKPVHALEGNRARRPASHFRNGTQGTAAILKDPRSRFALVGPPILQCLIFGYAATYDLNHVPYVALDQDRSAASRALLAKLDGSGVFDRVANLGRAGDIADYINDRRALLAIQIDPEFERRLFAGVPAEVQVIADGRNSNTAGTAMGYLQAVINAFNAQWQADHGVSAPPLQVVGRAWYNPSLETAGSWSRR
jgi:ABC-2 type transport system permease protein